MIAPIRGGDTLDEHCAFLARYARALSEQAVFLEGLASSRGHLTNAHVELHSARLSIARAKDAIERVAAQADRFVKEPA